MRVGVLATLALSPVITPIPVHAQETETLRREIAQLKRQFAPTGATVACTFGVAILLWSGVARLRRRPVTVMEEST